MERECMNGREWESEIGRELEWGGGRVIVGERE